MRVLLINTSERIGGAAIAASRLMESLKNHGIKAKLLVRDKQTDQISVVSLDHNWRMVWKFVWERIVIWSANRFNKKNIFAVDIANTGTDITSLPEFQHADVIHLHWINQGMLSLKNIEKILASGKPVVWTMHDMWPCTGICHHARECTHYQQECHNCPFIHGGRGKRDLSYRIFHKKQALYRNRHINFVTCSRWLEERARTSALFCGHAVTCIPNPINTNLFKPRNRQEARSRCLLPQDKKLMLFGSVKITDKRKGIDYLIESCRLLADKHPELREQLGVVVFGNQSQQLENLLLPLILNKIQLQKQQLASSTYGIVDVPLLIENPAFKAETDRILVVDVPESVQIERVHQRNGFSEEQTRQIMATQASRTDRLLHADDVLDNTHSMEEAKIKVARLHQYYQSIAQTLKETA